MWGSIALADEARHLSDEALFVLSGGDEAIRTIRGCGYQVQTVSSLALEQDVLEKFQPDVVVVNKLNNAPEYIKFLKNLTDFVVTIDDAGEGAQWADLNINVLYHIPGAVTDTCYIALRNEFQQFHKQTKPIREEVRHLLVTQGGSDTYGLTPKILQALENMVVRPHCTAVVGPAFRHETELRAAVEDTTLDLTIIRNARNMADLMWQADLVITAGGVTMFELACVGTPSLVVCGEPFEVETAARLEKAGVVINLGFGSDVDYEQLPKAVDSLAADWGMRKGMSDCGKQLVDGKGSERMVQLIWKRVLETVDHP